MDDSKQTKPAGFLLEDYYIIPRKKTTGILSNYHRQIEYWELDIGGKINFRNIIDGKSAQKVLYNSNGLRVDWIHKKRSGEHRKDSGLIKFIDLCSGKTEAVLDIFRGNSKVFRVYNEKFALNLDNHKDMPFYNFIKETLVYKK